MRRNSLNVEFDLVAEKIAAIDALIVEAEKNLNWLSSGLYLLKIPTFMS